MSSLKQLLSLTIGLGSLAMTSVSVNAETIRQLDSGDLLVIDYKGKPPYERRVISAETAEFARFEEQVDSVAVLTTRQGRSGPPGKNLPSQRSRVVQVDADQVADFARFEESGAEVNNNRMWRGAPGKGRPQLNR